MHEAATKVTRNSLSLKEIFEKKRSPVYLWYVASCWMILMVFGFILKSISLYPFLLKIDKNLGYDYN